MNTGEVFSCPLGGFLDNGPNAVGPGSRTVECGSEQASGDFSLCYMDIQQT